MKVSFLVAVGLLLQLLPESGALAVSASGLAGRTAPPLTVGGLLAVKPGDAFEDRARRDNFSKVTKGDPPFEQSPGQSRQLKSANEPTRAPTIPPPPPTFVFLKPLFNNGNYSAPAEVDITQFKWLLVENNVGSYEGTLENPPAECDYDQNPVYPSGCDWPSIHSIKAHAPIYSSGDDTEWNKDVALEFPFADAGKYMVTIMAEGYRLCGAYFSVADDNMDIVNITVTAACQPHPLPLGTIRMFVFEDSKPCNGQYDPGERPLVDFGIGVNDIEGPILEDYYGNSIMNIVSDENGIIEVPNMWPNRYDLDVGAPPNEGWIKTNTLEGGHGWDYWLYEGWDGFDNEFIKGTEVFPMAVAGFIQVKNDVDQTSPDLITVTGKITAVSPWPNGLNFAEVNGINPGLNILPRERGGGTIFNQDGMIALSDLQDADQAKYVDLVNPDGSFTVNVTKGSWAISYFDITQQYILRTKTFTIGADQDASVPFDIGELPLTGWYTEVEGFFFIDSNANGVFDEDSEEGLAQGPFPVLRYRDGTQVDRGFQFEVPFADPIRKGFYKFSHGYPFASWITMHMYHPLWKISGYTYRTEQQTNVTTVLAQDDEYDIAIFGTPSLTTFLDVGFLPRERTTKGSVAGAVHYDSTRTNLDAAQAVVENHEPGIPGIQVHLYKIKDGGKDCKEECTRRQEPEFGYECKDVNNTKGSNICTQFWVGAEGETKPHPVMFWADKTTGQVALNSKTKVTFKTSEFKRPTNCLITDQNNTPLTFPDKQAVLPNPDEANPKSCIDTPLLRNQVGGFAMPDGGFKFTNLDSGYYAIQVEIPTDKRGKPMYQVRTENDVNAYDSDEWYGEGPVCPSSENETCPFSNEDGTPPTTPNLQNIKTPCAGSFFQVNSTAAGNLAFVKNGGSYVEGDQRRLCDTKIVYVEDGSAAKVLFNLFTIVPIPGRWKGLVLDDRLPEANPKAVLYTELRGIPHIPVGVRDYKGTMLTAVETDANGYFELLVPASRNNGNMLASGATFSASMYCLTANDPGSPSFLPDVELKADYRPIRACFEGMPGRITPVDLAPVSIRAPQLGQTGADVVDVSCDLPDLTPELYTVKNEMDLRPSGPICNNTDGICNLIIRGRNLISNGTYPVVWLSFPDEQMPFTGASPPNVNVTNFGETTFASNDTQPPYSHTYDEVVIEINVTRHNIFDHHHGMYQLHLQNSDGKEWFTGISVHLLGSGYDPTVYDTRDSDSTTPIQEAIDKWEAAVIAKITGGTPDATTLPGAIVLVYPNDVDVDNPTGAHVENVIMTYPGAKIQGIGPGRNGATSPTDPTRGTELNGAGYGAGSLCPNPDPNNPNQLFCDAQAQDLWRTSLVEKIGNRVIDNNALVEGQVLYVLSDKGIYEDGNWSRMELWGGVDGCVITGGSQAQPLNPVLGGNQEIPQIVAFQGGGVTLHTYTKLFRVTNNAIRGNSGSFAGAIRVGTAFLDLTGDMLNHNTELTISWNSIIYNGGFNLAGAIGLFRGSDNYVVENNFICGNSGQEYGGAISHFGPSQNGTIRGNLLLYNRAVDEGGGIIIASETVPVPLPDPQNIPGPGAAPPMPPQFIPDPIDAGNVEIVNNTIQGCLSGDDGGGIRFLNPGLSAYTVRFNTISHNVALHEGGGVSINDAPFVYFDNNKVVSNLATGTSAESDGNTLFAAGLATSGLSPSLKQRIINAGIVYDYNFSHPIDFRDNIFWDNRASNGHIIGNGSLAAPFELEGLGIYSNVSGSEVWYFDMGSSDSGKLIPMDSIVQTFDLFCPNGTQYGNFFLDPFKCMTVMDVTSNATFSSDANWGVELGLQVLGLTVTLGGSNTFVVSTAALKPGPIGFSVKTMDMIATARALFASRLIQEGNDVNLEDLTIGEPKTEAIDESVVAIQGDVAGRGLRESFPQEGAKEDSHMLKLYTALTAFLLVCIGVVSVARRNNQANDEPNPAFNKKSSFNGILLLSILGICVTGQAVADNCTVDCSAFGTPLPNQDLFVNELFIPEVVDLQANCSANLTMYMNINEKYDWGIKDENGTSLNTTLYGYSLWPDADTTKFPGPTLVVKKDCQLNVTFINNLGLGKHLFAIDTTVHCGPNAPNCTANGSERRTTTHLHGGHTKAKFDGHPRTWYTYSNDTEQVVGGEEFSLTDPSLFSGVNEYTNDQPACTLFYHDHALGITRLNVYAGLAGLYIIEDDFKKEVFNTTAIPQVGDPHHVPLAFADKMFTYQNGKAELQYPHGVTDPNGGDLPASSILPEMFGDVMSVNGKIYPYLEVDADGLYLFRMLNACDSRFIRLTFETQAGGLLPFTVVASDQGLLSDTDEIDEILLGPAERYEIVISFRGLEGQNVTVMNSENTLIGPVVEGIDDRFMQFRVRNATTTGTTGTPTSDAMLPSWNSSQVPYDEDFQSLIDLADPDVANENIIELNTINKRELWITEGTQVFADAKSPAGGRPLPMLGPRPNPFGLGYDDNATEIMLQNKPYIWELINLSVDAHVIHLHQVRFRVLDRQGVGLSYDTFQHPGGTYRQYPKNVEPVPAYEAGPKDTLISYPGTVTRLITKFDLVGLYVWHCHILSHEDNMMIRDLIIFNAVDFDTYTKSSKTKTGDSETTNTDGTKLPKGRRTRRRRNIRQ